MNQITAFDQDRFQKIKDREELLDRMADASNQYVLALSEHITLDSDDQQQNFQLKALVNFERIGDRASDINYSMQKIAESGKTFSEDALEDIKVATDAVHEILDMSVRAFKDKDLGTCKTGGAFGRGDR